MTDTTKHPEPDVVITTNKKHGEADLKFRSDTEARVKELHDIVVPAVDGVSIKKNVKDSVVAIRKRDFPEVVQRLKTYYEHDGHTVKVDVAKTVR